MTLTRTGAAAPATTASTASTSTEDAITLVITAWLIAGLFIDGYAHVNIIDTETEDFFTPWHAIFYAAFLSLAGWIFVIGRRRASAAPVMTWFPDGYQYAVFGVGIFALGGIGDGIWHTIFGVEVGIDALLSPTHLILFIGGLLLLWTPVRAAAARHDPSPALAVGAAALTTALLVFFTEYLFLLSETWIVGIRFEPRTSEGWEYVSLFLAAVVVQVIVLAGPLLLIARRWALPFGSATGIWTFAALLEMYAFDHDATAVQALAVGGVAFDITFRFASTRRVAVAAFIGPVVTFSTYFLLAADVQTIRWPPEIWGGAIMMAGFTGLGLVAMQESGRHEPITAKI
ncbi:MAG: hypothetical protein AAGC53_01685 [Actinomycetota bacterium]